MPKLVNTLAQRIRVTNEEGVETRLRPGQVVNVDGATADALSEIDGVESATSEHEAAWNAYLNEGNPTAGAGMDNILADARVSVAQATISAPLNVVIPDADAPMSPELGTITTKQAVMRESAEHKRAFGDHERLPEEAENEELSDVEREQAAAKRAVEELSAELIASAQPAQDEEEPKARRSRKPKQEPEPSQES